MKSEITGVEFNNPEICVRGSSFGCVCESCKKEMLDRLKELFREESTGEVKF